MSLSPSLIYISTLTQRHMHMCIYIYTDMCACIAKQARTTYNKADKFTHDQKYVNTYTSTNKNRHMLINLPIDTVHNVYVCMYIYIYVYIYVYMYILTTWPTHPIGFGISALAPTMYT